MQTFFLAVQEKGYFVLNDLFRYLPEPPQSASEPEPQPHAAPPPFAPIENGYSQPAVPSHVPYPPQVRSPESLPLYLVDHQQRQACLMCHFVHWHLLQQAYWALLSLSGCVTWHGACSRQCHNAFEI